MASKEPNNHGPAVKQKDNGNDLKNLDASKLKYMRVLDLQELAAKLKIPENEVAGIKKQDLALRAILDKQIMQPLKLA